MVYVLDKEGKPLMPTERYGKVRHLLINGEAVVVRRTPFTIQFVRDSDRYTQDVYLGIDAGSKHIGVSATTEKKELFAARVNLRGDIVQLLAKRKEARRFRRNRLRYRAARFSNRRGRTYFPSIWNKVEAHLKIIRMVHQMLPISNTTIEVAQFDTVKLSGKSDYMTGEQLGFWNIREYVLARDNHQCQHCKGRTRDKILNVHHIESRQTGGNAPNNLITLCETCHKAYHQGKIKLKVKRGNILKDATAMNFMRWRIYDKAKEEFENVFLTYGYATKHSRITNNVEKTHSADARCISGNPRAAPAKSLFIFRQIRRHNRHIYKQKLLKGGVKKRNQVPYITHGFRLFDKILYNGQECFIGARRLNGCFGVREIDGTIITTGVMCSKFKFLETRKSMIVTKTSHC